MSGGASRPVTVPPGERIASLDFIRGIAVMGILFANIAAFGQPMSAAFYPGAFLSPAAAGDEWLWLAQLVLIDGKMRGLFTLLFGAGLVLFIERAWARGAGAGLQLRRLFWLLIFGLAHYVLLWRGDILTSYAIAGAVALLFARWEARELLVLGIVAYVVGAMLTAWTYGYPEMVIASQGFPELRDALLQARDAALANDMTEAAIIRSGAYLAFVGSNLGKLPGEFGGSMFMAMLETVPLILIGMGLYRAGFFRGAVKDGKLLAFSSAGLLLGGGATLLLGLRAVEGGLTYFGSFSAIAGATMLPRLPMILGLAGLLLLLSGQARGWAGEGIRAAGQAAFTNYIGTSFVMLWLFHGFGLGLFGELNRAQLYGVALAAALLMPVWSRAWLNRFRYGPLEWLWRCLTYGKLFPLRQSMLANTNQASSVPQVNSGQDQ